MLLDERLLDVNFYLRSMSSFLRNSFGMEDRCRLLYGILTNVCDTENALSSRMNIFSQTFFADNYRTAGYDDELSYRNGNADAVLDNIASIFGLTRMVYFDKVDGSDSHVQTLSNYEFVLYIQAFIVKQTFDGTALSLKRIYCGNTFVTYLDPYISKFENTQYEQIVETYLDSFKTNEYYFLQELLIVYKNGANPLTQTIILQKSAVSKNIKYLYDNGYLTVESVGISYDRAMGKDVKVGKFESTNTTKETKFYQWDQETVFVFGERSSGGNSNEV